MGDLESVMGDYGRLIHCMSCNNIYHATSYQKILPSLQLAVRKFMTECFINPEFYAKRLHVGPSFDDHARVDF